MPVDVFLNHFYLTLAPETYRAVRENRFLPEEFAPFEQRTTRRNDTSYTGIYYYGRDTYFEFFEAGGASGRQAGDSAIAFGVEQAGGLEELKSLLPFGTTVTRRTEEGEPPWFHMRAGSLGTPGGGFRSWVMEYHAKFLDNWYPELPPKNANSLPRRNVLDRYVAKIGQAERRGRFLLKDVVEIEIAIDDADRKQFIQMLRAFGYQVSDTVCTGPGIRFTIVPAAGNFRGIRRVIFSLQRPVKEAIEQRMGVTRLVAGPGDGAVWTF